MTKSDTILKQSVLPTVYSDNNTEMISNTFSHRKFCWLVWYDNIVW